MILSASRRTDIPSFYSEWFYNRIKEGFLYVRNPMNQHQISRVELSPEVVDCIVFWTKNPANMIERLDELKEYMYYFQFTLTGYGRDMEAALLDKRGELAATFQKLSEKIGKQRVIWRYDPILLNERYTKEYHLKAFEEIAKRLDGCTQRAIISFIDLYAKTQRNTARLHLKNISEEDMRAIAGQIAEIAARHGMEVESCAESIDLEGVGVKHGSCIDKKLIEEIIGCKLTAGKDKNQRAECGCYESVETGLYNTCRNGCKYCYANFSDAAVMENIKAYDPLSPLLCGKVGPDDKITERKVKSHKDGQLSLL